MTNPYFDDEVVEVIEIWDSSTVEGAEVIEVNDITVPPPPAVHEMDDLDDVDLKPSDKITVLILDPATGAFRNAELDEVVPQQRGSVIFYVDQIPQSVPPGCIEGDWFTVVAGEDAGQIYEVQED